MPDSSEYFMQLGFTDDTANVFNKAIRLVTGGPAHALVIVLEVKPNGQHDRYYFESIVKVDKATHKNGVRGPVPLSNLMDWLAEKDTRSLVTVPEAGYLPITQDEARRAMAAMKAAVNTIHYAKVQLVSNLLAAVVKARITFGGGTSKKWTCCELPIRCRVLPSRFWELVGMDDVNADEFWPGGPSRYSLFDAAQRVVDKHGVVVA